ncbi:MAG: GTP-binding protein [Candidatus Lokiarchaeota archaeon]|nr:GTP-binding protein [Candidatus Lokiarchaeota archaeon]
MTLNKEELFNELFGKFQNLHNDVEALIISDHQGLIIAGKKSKNVDMELVSVLTAIINPILERIRNEFAFRKFGTASFDTDEHRLLFISIDEKITLSLVLNTMASVDKISPYAYFLAEKSAQIINEEEEKIQLKIPNFEYEAETEERLKNQIYQMRIDTGGIYRFKFIIIGDHEVGKTSIVRRYVDKKFLKDYRPTIGLNILMHQFEFIGNDINISLWDIGAQQFFRRFRKTYYMGAQAAFVVFDLTDNDTYLNAKKWYEELKEFINREDLPIVLVGNKTDLVEERCIDYQTGVNLANELSGMGSSQISYIETSALTGDNIEDAFSLIAYHYITKSQELEEKRLKDDLLDEIKKILSQNNTLELVFISETPFWTPGLQIITEIKELGTYEQFIDNDEEKIFQYSNGLILKNYLYDSIKLDDADGVFCILDARGKDHIDVSWKGLVDEIIDKLHENKVILIGIRVSESVNWSQLMEEFDITEKLEKKMVSLLFFKIGVEYRLEIYDQLKVMLNTIKNLN